MYRCQSFNIIFMYIDVLSINNPNFTNQIPLRYSHDLVIKEIIQTLLSVLFLDIYLEYDTRVSYCFPVLLDCHAIVALYQKYHLLIISHYTSIVSMPSGPEIDLIYLVLMTKYSPRSFWSNYTHCNTFDTCPLIRVIFSVMMCAISCNIVHLNTRYTNMTCIICNKFRIYQYTAI